MTEEQNLDDLKERLSGLAEQIARESFKKKLDYSVKSVRDVEKMLAEFHKLYKKTHDDEGLNGIALEFAAYILKVIERNFSSGTWKRDHPTFGKDVFPYEWEGVEIFPYSWCQKRIFDGPGDDVWQKFQVLVVNKEK